MSWPTPIQLSYLVEATERSSWSEAASSLGVSTSALAQGIAELEKRLGVSLFDKDGRTRVPTPAAEAATARAVRILAEYRELERWATQTSTGDVGTIRAGMIDTAAIHHFGDALVRFRRHHPELSVLLTVLPSAQLTDQLLAGMQDVIVAVAPADHDELESRPLVEEPIYVYGPKAAKPSKSRDVREWGPWISFPPDSRTRRLASRELQARGVAFDVVAESSQPAVIREMVRLGMGWTVLPAVDAEREPHALRRASDTPIATRVLSLTRRKDAAMAPAVERFVAMLSSERLDGAAPR